ncbi:hypothetical protein FOTG_19036 [Fusarium oxysporum f. sp. vasinfectum 25433]|nr:hypothetical protein FOTG_19036 [Fusarium oxysporum f. sp. vasinfectum 25433]
MSDENRPYIARMEMSATHEDKSVALWFEVSWNGIIEWWFSYRQCQIWQDGRRSLPTRA